MSIDYEQLKDFVKEAMFTGGGINEPSAPEGIPIRTPSSDISGREQDMGDPKANKLYDAALKAREATEQLVEKLDEPIYDAAYENAFKASACLRRVLNNLKESGAHPMPDQEVVPPPSKQQKYGNYLPYQGDLDYSGGGASSGMELEEQEQPAVPEAPVKQGARSKRMAAASSAGGKQSSGDIEQQLAAVLGGKGITPIALRDALVSLLADLGLPQAKPIAVKVAKGLQAKQKGQQS
jgi:hypothetical protein